MTNSESSGKDNSTESASTGEADATTQTCDEQLAAAKAAERRATADSKIKNHVMIAMTLGLVPIPVFDLALLIGNQIAMVNELSRLHGVPFKENRVKSIIISLIAGSAPLVAVGLGVGAKLIPGIGSLFGSGSVAVAGGAFTYAVGRVFDSHFESGGTLLDFDVKQMRSMFKRELKEGQEAAKEAAREEATQV